MLLIQRDGETIYLPPCCPHAVLALETGIMIGTDLYLVSDMLIRIRWAKVLALHAKYHADESSHEYLAQCFVGQLQEALKQHQIQRGCDGEGDSIEESDVLAGDDAFIITGAPDLTCSLDKITCFDDFFKPS